MGRTIKVDVGRHDCRARVARPGAGEAVRDGRLLVWLLLQILREDEDSHVVPRHRDAQAPIDQMSYLCRRGCLLNEASNISEDAI